MNDDRLDVLIDRAADRRASLSDWDELERAADADPTLWSWLGRAVRDDGLLSAAVDERVALADRIELPAGDVVAPPAVSSPWLALRPALGWAAAVLMAALWWVDAQDAPGIDVSPSSSNDVTVASPPAVPSAAELAADTIPIVSNNAVRSDDILAELPVLLVSTQEIAESGRTEVVFVRRTLERTVVDDVLTVAHDEHGMPMTVPASGRSDDTESF